MKKKDTSIFRRLSLWVIGFGLIVIFITMIFMLTYANQKGNETDTLQQTNLLASSADAFDSIIKQYHELSIQISGSPSILNYVLTNYHDPGSSNAEVLSQLAIAKFQHAYLSNIWLYDTRSGHIIDDMYHEKPSDESAYHVITRAYLSSAVSIEKLRYNGWFTSLFWYDGQLYIAREFPVIGEKKLGILFIRMDVDAIVRNQVLRGTGAGDLIVYDRKNRVIAFQSSSDSDAAEFEEMVSADEYYLEDAHHKYILVRSDLTGWYYGKVFPKYSLLTSHDFLPIIILLFVILLAALVFSRLIYSTVVVPMQKLAQSSRDMFSISDKNEISAISKSLSRYSESMKSYDSAISTISAQMSEQFFTDLLDGKPMHMNYIRTALHLLSCPLDLAGFLWVVVLRYRNKPNDNIPEHIARLIDKELQKQDVNNLKYHIHASEGRTAVILEIPAKTNQDAADAYRRYVLNQIVMTLSSLEVELEIGNGPIEYSLSGISNSCLAAEKGIRPLNELLHDETDDASSVPAADSGSVQGQYRILADQLFELVDDNRVWQALETLECQMDAYLSSSEQSSDFFTSCQQLRSALLTKAADSGISPDTFLENGVDPYMISEEMPASRIYDNTLAQGRACLKARQKKNKTSNHHLVQTAKKYIDQHYSEPSLSLSTIAENIGTSPGYLSKMFKANEKVSFVEYLNNLRVARAKELLADTDTKVRDIAQSIGFYSEQNFFRVFKRITHTTPSQYRSAHQKHR